MTLPRRAESYFDAWRFFKCIGKIKYCMLLRGALQLPEFYLGCFFDAQKMKTPLVSYIYWLCFRIFKFSAGCRKRLRRPFGRRNFMITNCESGFSAGGSR